MKRIAALISGLLAAWAAVVGQTAEPPAFHDGFATDTRSAYTVQSETDGRPDEYGNWSVNDAASVWYFEQERCLYLEAGDNDAVTLSRAVGAATSGVFTVRFRPRVLYPANGMLTVTLSATNDDSGYTVGLAGGHYETPFAKRVSGADTLSLSEKGPFFSSMDTIGEYDGEMTTQWRIQNPEFHTLALKFTPGRLEAFLDGRRIRELVDPQAVPIAVASFSIRAWQLECEIGEIAFAPSDQ